jgi:hypothetical protein
MVPAPEVRGFIERLRDASSSPVVYAELPGGQHTPDALDALLELMEREGIPSVAGTGNEDTPDDVCHPAEWRNRRTG